MRLRTLTIALGLWLALAAPALAGDNGEGVLGETDDKVVTLFSLGVLVFFVLVITIGSALQGWLNRRADERHAHRMRKRTGW